MNSAARNLPFESPAVVALKLTGCTMDRHGSFVLDVEDSEGCESHLTVSAWIDRNDRYVSVEQTLLIAVKRWDGDQTLAFEQASAWLAEQAEDVEDAILGAMHAARTSW